MAVKSIELVEEIDGKPHGLDYYDSLPQGTTYSVTRVYKITHDDGQPDQFFKLELMHDSYGDAKEVSHPKVVRPKVVNKTVFE